MGDGLIVEAVGALSRSVTRAGRLMVGMRVARYKQEMRSEDKAARLKAGLLTASQQRGQISAQDADRVGKDRVDKTA